MKTKTKNLIKGIIKTALHPKYLLSFLTDFDNLKLLKRDIRSVADGSVEFCPETYEKMMTEGKKRVLLVSHEMSLTGAPNTLLHCAKFFKTLGIESFVISPKRGEMEELFEKENIPFIYLNVNRYNINALKRFLKNFDFAVSNTILSYRFTEYFEGFIPMIWWVHEAKCIDLLCSRYPHMKKTLRRSKIVCAGTEYTKNCIRKYNPLVHDLTYFIPPVQRSVVKNNSRLNFTIIGTVDPRKAQDVFVDAVLKLPSEYQQKADFHIIGKGDSLYKELRKKTENINCIHWHDFYIDKKEYYEAIQNIDVLVCISRDDPDPNVVTEASMFSVPSIVSESVGQAPYIEQYKNGIVIPTDDPVALKNEFVKLIDNPQLIKDMEQNADYIYKNFYTPDIFIKKLNKILNAQSAENIYL